MKDLREECEKQKKKKVWTESWRIVSVPDVPHEFSGSGRDLAAVRHRCGAQKLSTHKEWVSLPVAKNNTKQHKQADEWDGEGYSQLWRWETAP